MPMEVKSNGSNSKLNSGNAKTANDNNDSTGCGIMYFGYGAMVNPVSRARRGVETLNHRPAVLDDFRLTFAYGGAGNIMKKRGWSVHGVLMECKTPKDWDLLKEFDAGYDCIDVNVLPYDNDEDQTVKAHIFVMAQDESENAKLPTEKLPQERYIRIIAQGMRKHGVDDEYIDYSILNVHYIPNRKPEEYLTFPEQMTKKGGSIKELAYKEYEKKAKKKGWFLIGNKIIQLGPHDPNSNFIKMLFTRVVGKPDATWITLQTLYDPDLPLCQTEQDVTPLHIAWAENQMVDTFKQAELEATTVAIIKDESSSSSSGRLKTALKKWSSRSK